jgi:tetratricopeptide (TPR) repeat protein
MEQKSTRDERSDGDFRYAAFISYRHVEPDRKWAKWLHAALETYNVPTRLVKDNKLPGKVGRIFRDEDEVPASADLKTEIESALVASRFLIVICSPRTPKSRWVNKEVERFRELGRHDQILALLIEGEPQDSFPKALVEIRRTITDAVGAERERIEDVEPLAADVRVTRTDESARTLRQWAKLRVLACLLGCRFDDLRQRETQRAARRMRNVITGLVGLFIVLTGLTAVSVYQRDQAITAKAEAERRRKESEAVIEFINTDVFAGATPERMPDRKVRDEIVAKMLEPASKAVRSKFKDQPLVEAAVMDQIATSFESLGRSSEAEPLFKDALECRRRVLGDDHPDTIRSINNYAGVLDSLGRAPEAEPFFKEALERRRRVLGDKHPDTIISLGNYAMVLDSLGRAPEAEPLCKDALERCRQVLGDDHPVTITLLNNYAFVLKSLGRSSESEPLYKDALERRRRVLGEDHPDTITSINNYANALESLGRWSEAEPFYKDALERRRRVLGEDHPDTIKSLSNYAFVLNLMGRWSEAEPLFKDALDRRRRVLGEDHPDTITSLNNYANLMYSLGRSSESEPLFKDALARSRRALGDDHPVTITSLSNYAVELHSRGRWSESEPLLMDALERRRRVLGGDHPDTITSINNYAGMLNSRGRSVESEQLLKDALERSRRVLGNDHPDTISSISSYAGVLESLGRSSEAEALFKEVLELRRRVLGDDHPKTILSVSNYAGILNSLGRSSEAEPFSREALNRAEMSPGLGPRHPHTRVYAQGRSLILDELKRPEEARAIREKFGLPAPDPVATDSNAAIAHLLTGAPAQAEPLFRKVLATLKARAPADDLLVAKARSGLGRALLAQGKTEEAEPILRQALATRIEKLGSEHVATRQTAGALAELLEKTGRAKEADALRTKHGIPIAEPSIKR